MQKKAPAITKGTWFQSISAKVYVMAATVTGHIFKEGVCEVGCIENIREKQTASLGHCKIKPALFVRCDYLVIIPASRQVLKDVPKLRKSFNPLIFNSIQQHCVVLWDFCPFDCITILQTGDFCESVSCRSRIEEMHRHKRAG